MPYFNKLIDIRKLEKKIGKLKKKAKRLKADVHEKEGEQLDDGWDWLSRARSSKYDCDKEYQ